MHALWGYSTCGVFFRPHVRRRRERGVCGAKPVMKAWVWGAIGLPTFARYPGLRICLVQFLQKPFETSMKAKDSVLFRLPTSLQSAAVTIGLMEMEKVLIL